MTVVYTYAANKELGEILRYNARKRGLSAALLYVRFLENGINNLAVEFGMGRPVPDFLGLSSLTLKRRSKGDGHIVIYQIDEPNGAINILHLYHTKMNLPRRLRREFR